MIPTTSSSGPLERVDRLERLADDGESDLELMTLIRNWVFMKTLVSYELNSDQGE